MSKMTEERLAMFRGERDAIRADEQEGVHRHGDHWHVVVFAEAVDEIDRRGNEIERLLAEILAHSEFCPEAWQRVATATAEPT